MSARDIYHNTVVEALKTDGWKITNDPLYLGYGGKHLYVDLGAEKTAIAAEKNGQKIAVEIKSFISLSPINDLQIAVGQYEIYRSVLSELESERLLDLAVNLKAYENIFQEKLGQLIINKIQLHLIIFDEKIRRIIKWIS
ncbi:element excision factor XisH family protein [Okeania sp.]|uniref:element excision factor XisH family protein n=1 Tax=Okeania sp. TaxID=3100323 RepID=UPI002B4B5E8E|nr:element excision factor XisH family protein [Okeania sp.]MEB3342175.1 element excision factor XisH family protein [Okeania sp.]